MADINPDWERNYAEAVRESEAREAQEGACSAREDGKHCEHWWDGGPNGESHLGEPCCSCGLGGKADGVAHSGTEARHG